MKLFFSVILLNIFLSFQLGAQKAVDLDAFFTAIESGQTAVYATTDSEILMPFTAEKTRHIAFYEVLRQGDGTAYFYEHNYWAINNKSSIQICHCEEAELLSYFQQQQKYWEGLKEGEFSFNFSSSNWNFFEDNCMFQMSSAIPILDQGPMIQKLLNGQIPASNSLAEDVKIINENVEPRMLKRADGSWVLDLGGTFPSGQRLLRFEDSHALFSIEDSNGRLIYPPPSVDEWKRELVTNGHFSTTQLGGLPDGYSNQRNGFHPFITNKYDQNWNMLFQLYPETQDFGDHFHVKGTLFASIISDKTETITQSVPPEFFTTPGWQIKVVDGVLSFINPGNGSSLFGAPSMLWTEATIFNDKKEAIAYFTVESKEAFLLESPLAQSLSVEITKHLEQKVAIIIDEKVSTTALKDTSSRFQENEPYLLSMTLAKSNDTIPTRQDGFQVKHVLKLPNNNRLIGVDLLFLTDDTGKNMLLYQNKLALTTSSNTPTFTSIETNTFRPNGPWYEFTIHSLDAPTSTAHQVTIKADLRINIDGQIQTKPFSTTVSLGSFRKEQVSPATSKKKTPIDSAIQPTTISISTIEGAFFQEGIGATFRIAPAKGYTFHQLLKDQSELKSMQDDTGTDFILEHGQKFESRIDFMKTGWINTDEESINKQTFISYGYASTESNNFFLGIHSFALPNTHAERIIGSAKVAYWGYKTGEQDVTDINVFLGNQEELVIEVSGENFTLRKSWSTDEDSEGLSYASFTPGQESSIHIHKISAFSKDGKALGTDVSSWRQPTTFSILETSLNESIILKIEYSDTEVLTTEFNFDFGFGSFAR